MTRFKLWKDWRKCSLNSKWFQILVLFGLAHSPTFEFFKNSYLEDDV